MANTPRSLWDYLPLGVQARVEPWPPKLKVIYVVCYWILILMFIVGGHETTWYERVWWVFILAGAPFTLDRLWGKRQK